MVQSGYKEVNYEYNQDSLDRHKVSRADVNEVLANSNITTRDFDLSLGQNDELRLMFVGYNLSGRLLEVGVEFVSEVKAYIFHAQTVSPKYRKCYEERIANE